MKEETRKRFEELERRIRELEARPPVVVQPPQWINWPNTWTAPNPAWPPYTITCTDGVGVSIPVPQWS